MAAHSAEECPHHDLRTLFLARPVGLMVHLTAVLQRDLEVHLLEISVLEADLSAGSCWVLDLVGHLYHYPLGGIRRSWKVCGKVVEICRADIGCCLDIDWRT